MVDSLSTGCYGVPMQSLWFPIGIFVSLFLGGAVAGVVYLFIGGTGVTRLQAKRISALESDIDLVAERLTREIKRRSGLIAAEAKADDRSVKQVQRDAERRLAEETTKKAPVPGFPSMFNG